MAIIIINKMVVDKFGREYSPLRLGGGQMIRGPPGTGFKLTSSGDYNIEHKRICNVANPIDDTDAVNKQSTLIVHKDNVSMRKRRLIELGNPIMDSDATTKKYVHNMLNENCITANKDGDIEVFNAKRRKIAHVAPSTNPEDCVIKKQLDDAKDDINRKYRRLNKIAKNIIQIFSTDYQDRNNLTAKVLKAIYLLLGDIVYVIRDVHKNHNFLGKMNMSELNKLNAEITDTLIPSSSALTSLVSLQQQNPNQSASYLRDKSNVKGVEEEENEEYDED